MSEILVYVETSGNAPINNSLEILGKAREMADAKGGKVTAALIGTDLAEAANKAVQYGADQAVVVEREQYQMEDYGAILAEIGKKYQADIILLPSTQDGKDLGAVLGEKLGAACAVDVIDIQEENDQLIFTCPIYGGSLLNDIQLNSEVKIALIRSGVFEKNADENRQGETILEEINTPADQILSIIKDKVQEIAETVNLEEADVIVSGGRGMGSKENFQLVEQLAQVCGGVVGATRPAIEDEWISRAHQVGQSGKIVAPKLYIACGISGATQHVSGMSGSGFIVAINKDEDAPIFDVADVGIVGDAVKVIPLLIEEIQKM